MVKYMHYFQTRAEESAAYGSSAYTEPWVSSSAEGGVRYNNNNWVLIPGGANAVFGPAFSADDNPIVYFVTRGNRKDGEHNVTLVQKVSANNLQVWTDARVKGQMYTVYEINLVTGAVFDSMGVPPA